jgi:hypothetical protein
MSNGATTKLLADAFFLILSDKRLRTVTAFFPPLSDVKERVRVTSSKGHGFHVEIGRPNYREREYLKLCKGAGSRPRQFWFKNF